MEKTCPGRKCHSPTRQLPLANQRLLHFLTDLGKPLPWVLKSVTWLAGSPFPDGTKSHPPSRANISPYKHFASPNGVNSVKASEKGHAWSVLGNQSICVQLARSTFFTYKCKRLLKFLRRTTFLNINGIFSSLLLSDCFLLVSFRF